LVKVPGVGAFVGRLSDDSIFRRHPRDTQYMRDLVAHAHGAEYVPRIREVTRAKALGREALGDRRAVVLLWRDGNGTGWLPLESRVMRYKSPTTRVLVLNGRRRQFELTGNAWAAFLLRRFMGKSLIVEALFAVAFVVSSPLLAAWDRARGHR
jgi:hypothetical protein